MLIIIFCQIIIQLSAQAYFTKIIQNLELIPRNVNTNLGKVELEGTIPLNKYHTMHIVQLTNKKNKTNTYKSITSSNAFYYTTNIKAGKFRYDFEIYFYGVDTLKYTIENVVCGDVYFIQGQSNAVANSYNGLANTTYFDSFIRSYGSSSTSNITCFADTLWHFVNGDNIYSSGSIGQWGLVIAKYILDSLNIPVAILNGAVGGTSVVAHQKYYVDPINLYTIYGRLLYRAKKAKIENAIRGLFYFQGETDGTNPKLHDSLFRKLYKDWAVDYPNIKKYYIVQVRGGGCGSPTAEFLEVQRQFEYSLSKCTVVSSNGLNAHDGCHYGFVNGYEQLGKTLIPLVSRDLYGIKNLKNIDPPKIKSAEYFNADFTKVILEFEMQNDSIFGDLQFHQLFFITGEPGINISSGTIINNKIILTLNKGTCNPLYLSYMGQAGIKPWIKNKIKSGLVGFHLIPILKPRIKTLYFACKNSNITVGSDSISGYKYNWKNTLNNKVFTTSKFNYKISKNEQFKLILTNNLSACKSDTFLVNIFLDNTAIQNLGNDTIMCNKDTLLFIAQNNYESHYWVKNNIKINTENVKIDSAANLILVAKTNIGCTISDSITIKYSYPKVKIIAPEKICKNTDTLISSNINFKQYQWDNSSVDTSKMVRAKFGKHSILIKDSANCGSSDSIEIQAFENINYTPFNVSICANDSVKIDLPNGMKYWENYTIKMPNVFYFNSKTTKKIKMYDSNNCVYNDSINTTIFTPQIFNLGNDTSVCKGQFVKTTCSRYMPIYNWNNGRTSQNYYESNNDTLVFCRITDHNNCSYYDERKLKILPLPNIQFLADTVLCANEKLVFVSTKDEKFLLNGQEEDSIIISAAGVFNIGIKNKNNCLNAKYISVTYKSCVNAFNNFIENNIVIYPNPVKCNLYINNKSNSNFALELTDAKGKLLFSGFSTSGLVHTINTTSFKNGLYFIKLKNNNSNVLSKILIDN